MLTVEYALSREQDLKDCTGSNPVLTTKQLKIKVMKKTYSQLQFELSQLLYLQNSRFGNSEPSLEEHWKIQTRIGEVRNQIKELK